MTNTDAAPTAEQIVADIADLIYEWQNAGAVDAPALLARITELLNGTR